MDFTGGLTWQMLISASKTYQEVEELLQYVVAQLTPVNNLPLLPLHVQATLACRDLCENPYYDFFPME